MKDFYEWAEELVIEILQLAAQTSGRQDRVLVILSPVQQGEESHSIGSRR